MRRSVSSWSRRENEGGSAFQQLRSHSFQIGSSCGDPVDTEYLMEMWAQNGRKSLPRIGSTAAMLVRQREALAVTVAKDGL